MNSFDINKIANRRRLDDDSSQIDEKVSRQTKNIIKLRVNQDAAYRNLEVKVQQVQSNYENLQQNMLDVQMQHEVISVKCQEELRLRPDTLNRSNHTREMCEVVMNYSERLKEILTRVTSDQQTLYQAYHDSGKEIEKMKIEHQEIQKCSKLKIEGLQEKTKLMTEHMNSLHQVFTASEQRFKSELASTRSALNNAQIKRDEMNCSLIDANRQLEECKFQLEKKDEINRNLHNDMNQVLQKFNTKTLELQNTIANQQKKMQQIIESNQSLQSDLSNQEAFTKVVSDQNLELKEKIAFLEEQNSTLRDEVKELEKNSELLSNAQKEIESLNSHILQMEMEKTEINKQLHNNIKESDSKTFKIQELGDQVTGLEKKIRELENENKIHRETFEGQIQQMRSIIDNKDKELNSISEIVNELMSQVKNNADVRANLETHIQKLEAQIEREKGNAKETENKLEEHVKRLKCDVEEKEEQLEKIMQDLLGGMAEKDRLQDKITEMQNKIDNIQKELNGSEVPKPQEPAEQDDNAMSSPVITMKKPTLRPPTFDPVSNVRNAEDIVLNMFEYSSDYGDSIDSAIVNSRYEALQRGEHLPPVPMAMLKRRGPRLPTPVRRVHFAADQQNPLQLTRAKNDPKKENKCFKSKCVKQKKKKY